MSSAEQGEGAAHAAVVLRPAAYAVHNMMDIDARGAADHSAGEHVPERRADSQRQVTVAEAAA